jgi:chromosome partitioning protein
MHWRGEAMGEGAPKETTVITVGMQKGGVAKTTNTLHLAVALAQRGRRCLVWDVDVNHGATKRLNIPPEAFAGTIHILTGDIEVEEAVLGFDDEDVDIALPENLDFIAASRDLERLDQELARANKFYNPNDVLKPHIAKLRALGKYDYVLLDTGPSAHTTTRAAYLVADYFILSIIPEKAAVDAIPDALQDIKDATQSGLNPHLHLLGVILSCMDRRVTLARRYEEFIAERFRAANAEPMKFKTTIGRAAAIGRAAVHGKTVLEAEPTHEVAQQFRDLALEVEERIHNHRLGGAARAISHG